MAYPEDDNATVRISGNDSLSEGENKVVVTVAAEAGNTMEYVIYVTKEAAPQEGVDTPTIIPDKKHGSFELVRLNEDVYAVYSGKYKIMEPPQDLKVPSGYIKTKIIISGISIPVFAPEQLDSEFLWYMRKTNWEKQVYTYDRLRNNAEIQGRDPADL